MAKFIIYRESAEVEYIINTNNIERLVCNEEGYRMDTTDASFKLDKQSYESIKHQLYYEADNQKLLLGTMRDIYGLLRARLR